MNYRICLLLLIVGFDGKPFALGAPARISRFPSSFPIGGF